MKVVINGVVFDSKDFKSMLVIMSEHDKHNINNMPKDNFKYLIFDDKRMSVEEAKEYIKKDW